MKYAYADARRFANERGNFYIIFLKLMCHSFFSFFSFTRHIFFLFSGMTMRAPLRLFDSNLSLMCGAFLSESAELGGSQDGSVFRV